MKNDGRKGTYLLQKGGEEPYKAYVPPKLPPNPSLNLTLLSPLLERASLAIAELNATAKKIPSLSLFIYMYIRKESLLSCQIEGTQSSFSDLLLFENSQKPTVSLDDVEEVSNYIRAMHYGLKKLRGDFPLSLRLLREMHAILLSGGRGSGKLPGEFRRSQNWIGGTRPGNAFFVPPPPDHLMECLSDFEKFLHDTKVKLPILIKAGLVHVQFETIHPFLDGNGRLGRLLITLFICANGILDEPILYLSLYFKKHQETYYNLLQEVRTHGTWETWLEFFLEGVELSAKSGLQTANEINTLFDRDVAKIETLGRAKFSCLKIFEYLKKLPQVTVPFLSKQLALSPPTARVALSHLVELGILEEVSEKKRDKIYLYRSYLNLLEKEEII